ncbi:acyl carrier protein [Micromonospora sp. NPDC053740]|uniref:acyl carrier protein n=1 Tax=Micromonospora TaxID=1873 RepID=UPI001EE80175|nr:acyl carrier protein [Micromonospora alfalfae]MCG5461605.1 acyl carrier protein [Micromonospora alfalfae]
MTGSNDDFLGAVLEFLRDLNTSTETQRPTMGTELGADTDLIQAGIVDSLSIMELIVFLEKETGAHVPLEDLMLDSIRTARTIAAVYGSHTTPVAR